MPAVSETKREKCGLITDPVYLGRQSMLSPQFDILGLLASQGYQTAHPSERFHNVRTF